MRKILIGTSVRENEEIFKYYLDSLDSLIVPDGYEIHRYFVLHNSENLAPMLQSHKEYRRKLGFKVFNDSTEYKKDAVTHHWNNRAIDSISSIKNHLLEIARQNNYDYMFFVDSDLILNPNTLSKLIESRKDIIAEIFWTSWKPGESERPNAWDQDANTFKLEVNEPELYKELMSLSAEEQIKYAKKLKYEIWKKPGVYKVGMTGACILLSRNVLNCPHINYNRVRNVSFCGEDRHFCIRAMSHDFEIWMDTHYPAIHLYRASELEKFKKLHKTFN